MLTASGILQSRILQLLTLLFCGNYLASASWVLEHILCATDAECWVCVLHPSNTWTSASYLLMAGKEYEDRCILVNWGATWGKRRNPKWGKPIGQRERRERDGERQQGVKGRSYNRQSLELKSWKQQTYLTQCLRVRDPGAAPLCSPGSARFKSL